MGARAVTEEEMLEELKTWDDAVWENFKKTNYETICIGFAPSTEPLKTRLDKIKIGKYWFKNK